MDDREAYRLIADLGQSDGAISVYRPAVEALVADLVGRKFHSTDQVEKIRLRARPERWDAALSRDECYIAT